MALRKVACDLLRAPPGGKEQGTGRAGQIHQVHVRRVEPRRDVRRREGPDVESGFMAWLEVPVRRPVGLAERERGEGAARPQASAGLGDRQVRVGEGIPRRHFSWPDTAGRPAYDHVPEADRDRRGSRSCLDAGRRVAYTSALSRLSRDGLIESQRQPQSVKRDRVVHHLTPAGRAELDRWLAEPSARLRGYRDDFFLKLMAAVQAGDPATLEGVLRRQRAHLLRELRGLAEARKQSPSAVDSLLITAAELHIRADLEVVDAAEKSLEHELAAASGSASAAVSPGGQASPVAALAAEAAAATETAQAAGPAAS